MMIGTVDALTGLRVLLLENDIADAELVTHALKRLDPEIHVDLCATRKQFTDMLAAHKYDLVLADYRLPNWTGMEALKELRRLGFDTPIIVVTGTLGDERAVECVRFGAADYVLKGNFTRLAVAAKHALEEKRTRDASVVAQR
jgi:DNA-binding NtrC family response regulator